MQACGSLSNADLRPRKLIKKFIDRARAAQIDFFLD
jgi:hypothetical protein